MQVGQVGEVKRKCHFSGCKPPFYIEDKNLETTVFTLRLIYTTSTCFSVLCVHYLKCHGWDKNVLQFWNVPATQEPATILLQGSVVGRCSSFKNGHCTKKAT